MQRGQLRPGEDVKTEGGRVQVSGQVAVMAINALLTKVIFDKNPDHAFYVEESFPLDWMYPYLTPYGIIMKINRQPLPELTQDILERDHEFWCQYSTRLIGNWITYDTPISNICQFAESVYLHRDYSQFNGDRKFIRDSDAQKAFSKLRSSIGGVYAWRVQNSRTPEERERMFKEAEFAFKQALAFCPYSPEAVFRYINLLLGNNPSQRADDALLIARTCKKLDPGNPQLDDLIRRLEAIKRDTANMAVLQSQLGQLRQQFDKDPNVSNAFQLAQVYLSMQRTGEAVQVFLRALSDPRLDASGAISIANAFVQLNQLGPLETALNRLVQISPDSPEGNYDLAAVESLLNKPSNAIVHLRTALTLSANRLKADPKAKNLMEECLKDTRFNSLRSNPDFQKLLDQFR
jgi:tetratricopeptide (TPR) repeat protein